MMFQARNLFPSEAADEICKVLGLKPNALVEPMVGKGNYRIAGTEDRLEIRFKKARIVRGFYSERAEKARRQAVKGCGRKEEEGGRHFGLQESYSRPLRQCWPEIFWS